MVGRPCFLQRTGGLAVLAVLVVVGMTARAQSSPPFTRTAEVEPGDEVEVITEHESIHVTSWDRSTVEMRIEGKGPGQDAGAPVEIQKNRSGIRIRASQADPEGAGFWNLLGFGGDGSDVRYVLRVPSTAPLSVTTQGGHVVVRGVEAEVVVESYSGPMTLQNVTGEVTAASFSGPLHAENVRGPLTFATFSGDATIRGTGLREEHEIASFSGDAKVVLPPEAAFDLDTDVGWSDGVTSGFDLPEEKDGPISVGGGGAEIAFESFSGDLRLRAK